MPKRSYPQSPPSPTELTIGHNVSSKEQVDAVMAQARKAGAKIIKPAQDTFWGGYTSYFQDPDGHLWDIAWNPGWPVPDWPVYEYRAKPSPCQLDRSAAII